MYVTLYLNRLQASVFVVKTFYDLTESLYMTIIKFCQIG